MVCPGSTLSSRSKRQFQESSPDRCCEASAKVLRIFLCEGSLVVAVSIKADENTIRSHGFWISKLVKDCRDAFVRIKQGCGFHGWRMAPLLEGVPPEQPSIPKQKTSRWQCEIQKRVPSAKVVPDAPAAPLRLSRQTGRLNHKPLKRRQLPPALISMSKRSRATNNVAQGIFAGLKACSTPGLTGGT